MEYSKEYLAMQQKLDGAKPRRVLVVGNSAIAHAVKKRLKDKSLPVIEPGTRTVGPTPGYPHGATIFDPPTKGKKVRHVFIEATFPELKSGEMYQHAHGEATSSKAAISRAFKNLLKTIPKKRISVIKATISISIKTVEG